MSRPTVYRYFEDRDALVQDTLGRAGSDLIRRHARPAPDPQDRYPDVASFSAAQIQGRNSARRAMTPILALSPLSPERAKASASSGTETRSSPAASGGA